MKKVLCLLAMPFALVGCYPTKTEVVDYSEPTEELARAPSPAPDAAGDTYAQVAENTFQTVTQAPLSTFALDVDNASYTNVRRFLHDGQLPPPAAVRVEEMLNFFHYDLPAPRAG